MKKYSLKINGNEYEVKVENVNEASTEARVVVNGVKYNVEIEGATARQTSKPAVAPAPAATGLSVTPVTPLASKPAAPAAAGHEYLRQHRDYNFLSGHPVRNPPWHQPDR